MVWRRLGDVASTRMDKAPDCKSCDAGGGGRGEGGTGLAFTGVLLKVVGTW